MTDARNTAQAALSPAQAPTPAGWPARASI